MNTKLVVFLAHDPGGYDVTRPVYHWMTEQNKPVRSFCVGPAASLSEEHAVTETDLFLYLNKLLPLGSISVLVTGTSWGTDVELRAIRLCQTHHVSTIAVIDYWSNYMMRLHDQENSVVIPEYYVVMDELAKKEALVEGIPEKVIRVLGHPGLDRYVNYPVQHNNSRGHSVLFISQPLSLLYGNSLGYTEDSALEEIYEACKQTNLQLHVKFHPKDEWSFQEKYKLLAVQGDLLKILPQYDVIIGMSSMALLHAFILGINTVSYQPRLHKEDMCITNRLGLTTSINSYSELVVYLTTNNKRTETEIPRRECIWLDGKSTERVALFVEDVVQNGKN